MSREIQRNHTKVLIYIRVAELVAPFACVGTGRVEAYQRNA